MSNAKTENSLSDFFARKDAKKKNKGKVTEAKPKPKPVVPQGQGMSATPAGATASSPTAPREATEPVVGSMKATADDEWIVEEELVADYSGLRVADLSLGEKPESADVEESTVPKEPEVQESKGKQWGKTKAMNKNAVSSRAFPTLADTTQGLNEPTAPGMKNMKTVRNGYRGDGPSSAGKNISLSNKYDALGNR
eukprot:CFRG6267T1